MEISLIRHGKSLLTENDTITFLEFKQWVEKYDSHGVFGATIYPSETLEKIATTNIVITSDLKRSFESAMLLSPKVKTIPNRLYREIELPNHSIKLFNLKFKPGIWAIILRLLWFSGYSNECESFSNAKLRAKNATHQLIDYAYEYKSVVLVGHGFFNMLIAKELQKTGWRSKRKMSAKHWNCNTYTLLD